VETGRVKPFVHKNNTSALAAIFRDSLRLAKVDAPKDLKASISKAFDHWHDNPLACLLDLGLSKLWRDYAHIFVGSDLVTYAQFAAIEAQGDRVKQVMHLCSLQRILELLMLAKQERTTRKAQGFFFFLK